MNTRSVDDHDSPWKEALEQRFPEFLALLFPDVYEQVDWSQGRGFLDRSVGRMRRGTKMLTRKKAACSQTASSPKRLCNIDSSK